MPFRIMFLLVALLSTSTVAVAQSSGGDWFVAKTKDSSNQLIFRYRAVIPPWAHRSSWHELVAISWPLRAGNAMPTSDESKRQYAFEDSLQDAVEGPHAGFLAAVRTGRGRVEWLYYAPDRKRFMALLNKSLKGKPLLPIHISLDSDPTWSNYESIAVHAK
jgi:hypothetical protein